MLQQIVKQALLSRVYDVAIETSLDYAPLLSDRLSNLIYLKREDEQPVFSFKLRGAYNKMALLSPDQLSRGVVAASAGNHAQGVALSASRLGTKATIVMPRTTPQIKVDSVQRLGGTVELCGDNYDEAYEHAMRLASEKGLTFVHPYDDTDVIAGQATIALEILKQHTKPIDAVFVAVGGGGLIAGVGAVIKYLRPDIKIIGVEPSDADALDRSLKAGERITLSTVGRFADGVAVKKVGEKTFEIAKEVVDEMVIVSNDQICAAIKDIFEDRRAILEPAGALAYAGLKAYVEREGVSGKCYVAIACGANINFDSLRFVSERAEIGERREAVFAVTIPERAGSFKEFCQTIGDRSVTEFNYRYADTSEAHVYVGIKVEDACESRELLLTLQQKGYKTLDLTDNETAKLHIRHMVGGRAPSAVHERLFSFTYPERPGALLDFLSSMGQSWNISLFHYRNHGSDYGKVLVGMQVPDGELPDLQRFLDGLGYEYADESQNPACQLFLT